MCDQTKSNLLRTYAAQSPVEAKARNSDDFRARSENVRASKPPSINSVIKVKREMASPAADNPMMN